MSEEWNAIVKRERLKNLQCPHCGVVMEHFSGLECSPSFYYCPVCNDAGYNEEGEYLFEITGDIPLEEEE